MANGKGGGYVNFAKDAVIAGAAAAAVDGISEVSKAPFLNDQAPFFGSAKPLRISFKLHSPLTRHPKVVFLFAMLRAEHRFSPAMFPFSQSLPPCAGVMHLRSWVII